MFPSASGSTPTVSVRNGAISSATESGKAHAYREGVLLNGAF